MTDPEHWAIRLRAMDRERTRLVSTDRHANARDRKRDKSRHQDAMRGKRSVFEVQKAIVKRGRQAREALRIRTEKP
jgi:hypothetical protein